MLLQVLAGLACLFGALLQFAVYRSPTIRDSGIMHNARRIAIAAMVCATLYILHAVVYTTPPENIVFLIMGLYGMSCMLGAISLLLPDLERNRLWGSHLNSLR